MKHIKEALISGAFACLVAGHAWGENVSGAHFEEFVKAAGLEGSDAGFESDPDGDHEINLVEFVLAGAPSDGSLAGRQFIALRPDALVSYRQRISSPGAHVMIRYSMDLEDWRDDQSLLTEVGREVLPDGRTELVSVLINDPETASSSSVFASVMVSDDLFVPRFSVPPEATTPTTVSMTAGEADLDPRTVEYYFEALTAGGHDSGWQRDRLYVDVGLVPGGTNAYRVKIRSIDIDTGSPLAESGYSRTASAVTPTTGNKPNVIVIMADDIGWEVFPFYGEAEYETPRLETLVAQGMKFTNFHSQPVCTPSRVQIMTGLYNHRNYTAFKELDPGEITFGDFFQDAGYRTCIAGKWQLSYHDYQQPHDQGFEEYLLWHFGSPKGSRYFEPKIFTTTTDGSSNRVPVSATDYGPDLFTDFIIDFITDHQDEPFFVYYPMALVHSPFNSTPDTPEGVSGNKEHLKYMLTYMDKLIGRILDTLDDLGLRNDTLVLFAGDNGTDIKITSVFNGEDYPGGKNQLTDNGTHVPFVATWPGHIPEGSVCDDLSDFSDFVPTVTDIAGIPLPQDVNFDGRSLRSQLLGRSRDPRRWVYCYRKQKPNSIAEVVIRNKEWKLYRSGDAHVRAGNFYNVVTDFFEVTPVIPDPGSELEKLRDEFQAVLDRMDADNLRE